MENLPTQIEDRLLPQSLERLLDEPGDWWTEHARSEFSAEVADEIEYAREAGASARMLSLAFWMGIGTAGVVAAWLLL